MRWYPPHYSNGSHLKVAALEHFSLFLEYAALADEAGKLRNRPPRTYAYAIWSIAISR